VPERWSEEWVAALDAAARRHEGLREASRGRHATVAQEVVDGSRRNRWHLVLDDGDVAVRSGWPEEPDVTFTQDAAVADRIARGEVAARTAFVLGQVRLGGDPAVLVDLAPALAGLDDVFATVRSATAPAGDER
jgi:putative sterol carrier protein